MRAAMFNGLNRPITIDTLADPRPGPGDLLIQVRRCGVCGSDISMTGDGPMCLPLGRFGHEYAGEVAEVGRDVEGVKVGDRIAALPAAPCGACEGCRSNNPMLCERASYLVGGFGEYMVIPPVAARPLPKSLSFTDGALVEPMTCGLHALNLVRATKGDRVLVIGAGAMALSVVYWARMRGASKIAVLSRSAHRTDALMNMGADVILGFDPDDQAKISEHLGGPPNIVAEAVGKLGMLDLAFKHVAPRGAVISMGMCQQGEPVSPATWSRKEITLYFPRAYTIAEFEETARSFDAGKIRPDIMVSHSIALEDLPATMDAMRSGKMKSLKVHVDPTLKPATVG
jgi:(R,R)-butanediol dehydrogenase/meso-butanediol dehydrogenase/diacetyl reductase